MEVEKFSLGLLLTNLYLVYNEGGEAFMVDPAEGDEKVDKFIEDHSLKLKKIFITHTHADHVGGLSYYRDKYGAESYALILARDFKDNPAYNLSKTLGLPVNTIIDNYIDEDYEDPDFNIQILRTPGHAIDSLSLSTDLGIFTGDTLFWGSIGRYDFPGGDYDTLIRSIKEKLMVYDDNTIVYPGHGSNTTIGYEREHNPFLR